MLSPPTLHICSLWDCFFFFLLDFLRLLKINLIENVTVEEWQCHLTFTKLPTLLSAFACAVASPSEPSAHVWLRLSEAAAAWGHWLGSGLHSLHSARLGLSVVSLTILFPQAMRLFTSQRIVFLLMRSLWFAHKNSGAQCRDVPSQELETPSWERLSISIVSLVLGQASVFPLTKRCWTILLWVRWHHGSLVLLVLCLNWLLSAYHCSVFSPEGFISPSPQPPNYSYTLDLCVNWNQHPLDLSRSYSLKIFSSTPFDLRLSLFFPLFIKNCTSLWSSVKSQYTYSGCHVQISAVNVSVSLNTFEMFD